MVKVFSGAFRKKDGSVRVMRWVDLIDVPQHIMDATVKGTGKKATLAAGSFHVWDIDARGIRIYNSETATTDIVVSEDDVKF